MTLRSVLICAAVSLSSLSAFADDQSVDAQDQISVTVEAGALAPQYFHGPGRQPRARAWICQAENSHGSYQHYNGQPSYSRYEAQHSALDQCQYYEGHTCVLAGCQPYGY